MKTDRPATSPQKSSLFGGIVLCVFPAIVFLVAHDALVMPWPILFALFFFHGVWIVISSLFRLDSGGAMSWLVGAMGAAGFAVFVFWMAFGGKDFSGGIPFIPAAWNQSIARLLVAFGGLIAVISAVVFLRKALKRFRKDHDGVV